MASKIFMLKQKVLQNMPPGELPQVIFGRLMLKSGVLWTTIKEDTEIPPEKFNRALVAVEEVFGKKISI